MKKIILPLLILTFPFIGLSAQIKSFNWDGINYRLVKDSVNGNNNLSAMVINLGNDNYKGDIVIPSSVMHNGVGYPVTAIDNMAFRCCKQLTSITIPSSVVEIPAAAFYGSYNLKTIVVSDVNPKYDSRDSCNAVIETETNTLIASCDNTVVPQSVTALGDCSFFGHKGLTTLEIDRQYEKIGRWVFLDCENIETLYWNTSLSLTPVTELLKTSLKNVVLGDSVSSISAKAFTDCHKLESVIIPSGVNSIESEAFRNCESLKSIDIPSTVEYIGDNAFAGCNGLTSLTIPNGVQQIDYNSFEGCENVETLYWNSNANLSAVLRYMSSNLKKIVIGDSVRSLNLSAFRNCKNVISISVSPGNPVYDSRNDCNAIIETASNKLLLGCKNSTIPESVTAIGGEVFVYCGAPKTISLPSTLLSIADLAFSNCDSLTTLVVPANVNSIGRMIVYGCHSLTSLSVDPANTFFDSRDNCNAIIEKKTGRLIAGCNSSTIPAGVTAIAASSFSGFQLIKSINCPSGLRTIEYDAFSNCTGLESVSFPLGLDAIGMYAFSNCTSLKSISMPPTVKEIGDYAFSGCSEIRTAGPKGGGYDYEFSWDTIPANAFLGLSNLESVVIPKTVKAIYECRSDLITYSPDNYYSAVFEDCPNLKNVTVSFKDTRLYRYNNDGSYDESHMDYNLYKINPVSKLTVLDDTIFTFSNILTDSIKELVISKDVKVINPNAFVGSPYSTYFEYREWFYDEQYGYNIQRYFRRDVLLGSCLENITVEAGNSKYVSDNGVLFNSQGDELLAYPTGRKGDYKIPSTVKVIQDHAFSNSKINSVVIPKSVQRIGNSAFERCDSLKEVTIEGQSEIGLNAFHNCNNIQGVWTRSATPGLMTIFDEPQTIITNDFSSAQNGSITLNIVYDSELGRNVTEFSYPGYNDWQFGIYLPDIPAGNYKLSIGVLPSIDEKPVYIHPYVNAYTEKGSVRLLDSIKIELIDMQGFQFEMEVPYYMTNDVSGYDTLTIGNIEILEGYLRVMLYIQSGVFDNNSHLYSSRLLLDRIYIEPLDKDVPVETYAGTFTANVFNNATLYVPDGAIDTYKAAEGWKLFKNIAVNNRTYPADEVEVTIGESGYATFYYSLGDYALPEGLSAMVVSGISDDKLIYETIATGSDGGVIPAGVPVILASDNKQASVFKLCLTFGSFQYEGNNLLNGSDVATQTYAEGSNRFYKLAYGPSGTDLSDVLGWYWGAADGGAFNIEAHKAWLALPAAITHGIAGFSLSRDNTTFVIGIEAFDNESDATIYDLYGRKLSAPNGTGIIIINGKKIIINE